VWVARLGDPRAPEREGDEEEDEDADGDEDAADPGHDSSDAHDGGGYGTDPTRLRHRLGRLDPSSDPPVAWAVQWTESPSIFTPSSPSSAASPLWPASISTLPRARSCSCRGRTARGKRLFCGPAPGSFRSSTARRWSSVTTCGATADRCGATSRCWATRPGSTRTSPSPTTCGSSLGPRVRPAVPRCMTPSPASGSAVA